MRLQFLTCYLNLSYKILSQWQINHVFNIGKDLLLSVNWQNFSSLIQCWPSFQMLKMKNVGEKKKKKKENDVAKEAFIVIS